MDKDVIHLRRQMVSRWLWAIALVLISVHFLTVFPAEANKTLSQVTPPFTRPRFSIKPTTEEIIQARVFEEPIVPTRNGERGTGNSTSEASRHTEHGKQEPRTLNEERGTKNLENEVLAKALTAYSQRKNNDDVTAITQFLSSHPNSRWRVSLLTNLGLIYHKTGWWSKAFQAWEEAWQLGMGEPEPRAYTLVNQALGGLVELNTNFGLMDRVEFYLAQAKGRRINGSITEKITAGRECLWMMENRPESTYRCGSLALSTIRLARGPDTKINTLFFNAKATPKGFSLSMLAELADQGHMELQMARRTSSKAKIILPAVVHWKLGHFAALMKEGNGRYLSKDPTYGKDLWVSKAALDAESSGYFLVPQGTLPAGWVSVTTEEGHTIWGKGPTTTNDPGAVSGWDHQVPCGSGGTQRMARYSFNTMLASLRIEDDPVGYTPPRGPAVEFGVVYNQREANQPALFTYPNLGFKWAFSWISYLQDDPNNPSADVTLSTRSGGTLNFTGYDSANQTYAPETMTQAVLARTTSSSYELRYPDGSKEIFSQPDGLTTFPRRIFLTQVIDPMGNGVGLTFDSQFRLIAIRDALGQITTISYNPSDPLKMTRVTDPFGRFATFEYNAAGQLQKITDVIGMSSEFTYGANDFIESMTTPYGTTKFTHEGSEGPQLFRSLEATDPQGEKERLEMWREKPDFPASEPLEPSVPGVTFHNHSLYFRDSFFWDKKAMKEVPGDYFKAKIYHWLHDANSSVISRILESEKLPLEQRVWYRYPHQPLEWQITPNTINTPSVVARVLDDGTTQYSLFEYNTLGKVTKATDPLGRATTHIYDTNQIDLLEVHQTTGTQDDLLAKFSYNTQHLPLTATDASGQTTAFTYNLEGQFKTLTNPKSEITTLTYNPQGYLTQFAVNSSLLISFTYDNFGRVRTATNSENYTITTDYDALDRPTKVTYPDGTFEAITYNRLDPETTRDRLGRVTRRFYNALRQVIAIQDALNHVTQFEWCGCGTLEKITDPLGRVTTWIRDLQGRVTNKVYPDRSTFHYTYETSTSRLKSILDPKNQTTSYNYFLDNNIQQVSYANAVTPTPSVNFTYDPNYNRIATMMDSGNPPGQGDGTGTTTYAYNPITIPPALGAGRLSGIDGPLSNDVTLYSYDELGRVLNRTLNGVSSAVSYDSLGRVKTANNTLGTFLYNYLNATARLSSIGYPNSQKTTFSYFDNLGDQRLKKILHLDPSSSTLLKFDYEYNAEGQIMKWTQQSDVQTPVVYDFQYDHVDQLLSAQLKTQNLNLKTFIYSYDKAGNKTSEQIDRGVTKSVYNNLNQLTSQQAGGPMQFKGHLNKPSKVTISNGTTTVPATVDANNVFQGSVDVVPGTNTVSIVAVDFTPNRNTTTNRYQVVVSSGVNRTLSWDANGNLTSLPLTANSSLSCTWDARNRLVQIQQPTANGLQLTAFEYDGLNRRTRITGKLNGSITSDKYFVFDGLAMVEERDGNGNVVKQFFDQGVKILTGPNAGVYFYIFDHEGNIREIINSAGVVVARYDYDAFGRMTLVSGTDIADFGFQGMYVLHVSGMAYPVNLTWARVYDPDRGIWWSKDWVGKNDYVGMGNNPVRWTDPLGLIERLETDVPGGAGYLQAENWYETPITAAANTLSLANNGLHILGGAIGNLEERLGGPGARGVFAAFPLFAMEAAPLRLGAIECSAAKGASELTTVSRWGREGLESGDWIIKGEANTWNYIRSGKWDPFPWNKFAKPSSGQAFKVAKDAVKLPQNEGIMGKVKGWLLGQRQYLPKE